MEADMWTEKCNASTVDMQHRPITSHKLLTPGHWMTLDKPQAGLCTDIVRGRWFSDESPSNNSVMMTNSVWSDIFRIIFIQTAYAVVKTTTRKPLLWKSIIFYVGQRALEPMTANCPSGPALVPVPALMCNTLLRDKDSGATTEKHTHTHTCIHSTSLSHSTGTGPLQTVCSGC